MPRRNGGYNLYRLRNWAVGIIGAMGISANNCPNRGSLGDTLQRLSTGLKMNSAKDDPAGLIASELLQAPITGTDCFYYA